jgi:propanol-preferring alcohol dehydrogenase
VRAIVVEAPGRIHCVDRAVPEPGPGQVRVLVRACGVCRTDLHLLDGELDEARYPVVPGHEVVGLVDAYGSGAGRIPRGTRVGVPWLAWTCGQCGPCRQGAENLCERAAFTGCHVDGGYAEAVLVDERFCLPLPKGISDVEAAPLLCAGLIGFRSLRMAGDARRLGLYGFGAAAHIIAQVARHEGREVHAFVRPGDEKARALALELGAVWAGGSDEEPAQPLDAAIIFAPVGTLVPVALQAVRRGGVVVCGGIHMSDIPSFPYSLLWGERAVRSVANLTRQDGEDFMSLAAAVPLRVTTHVYPLADAARALDDLRHGRFTGAAVLSVA